MTDDRLRHQCHKTGCDSEARWAVRLVLHAKATGRQPIAMDGMTTIRCCDLHQEAARRYVLMGEHREAVNDTFRKNNLPLVDWDGARVEFYPVNERMEADRRPAPPVEAKRIIPCDRAECVLPAKFQIGVKIWAIGMKKTRARNVPQRVLTSLCVCASHRAKTTTADVLDVEGKSTLLGILAPRGFVTPDFGSAEMEFVPLWGGRFADPVMYERGQVLGEAA